MADTPPPESLRESEPLVVPSQDPPSGTPSGTSSGTPEVDPNRTPSPATPSGSTLTPNNLRDIAMMWRNSCNLAPEKTCVFNTETIQYEYFDTTKTVKIQYRIVRCLITCMCEYYSAHGDFTTRDFNARKTQVEDAIYDIFIEANQPPLMMTEQNVNFPTMSLSDIGDIHNLERSLLSKAESHMRNFFPRYILSATLDDQLYAHNVLHFYRNSPNYNTDYICRRAMCTAFVHQDQSFADDAHRFLGQFGEDMAKAHAEVAYVVYSYLNKKISKIGSENFIDVYSKMMTKKILPIVHKSALPKANLPKANSEEYIHMTLTTLLDSLKKIAKSLIPFQHNHAGFREADEITASVEFSYKFETNLDLYVYLRRELNSFGKCQGYCQKTLKETHGWNHEQENYQKICMLLSHVKRAKDFKNDKVLIKILVGGVTNVDEKLSDIVYDYIHQKAIEHLQLLTKPIIKIPKSSTPKVPVNAVAKTPSVSNNGNNQKSDKRRFRCKNCHHRDCKSDRDGCRSCEVCLEIHKRFKKYQSRRDDDSSDSGSDSSDTEDARSGAKRKGRSRRWKKKAKKTKSNTKDYSKKSK